MKEFCLGKTENCTSILKLNQGRSNLWTPEQQNAMRELKAALKSRPMRRLRDLQKRKYGTSPLLLGVHGNRIDLENRRGTTLELLDLELTDDNSQSDANVDDDNNDDDNILKKGEFVVFRGTDGLPFNILQLTKDYQYDSITHKTRIKGNFLTSEQSEDSESQETILFMSDPQWRNGVMIFAHALRDMDDKIVVLQMETVLRDSTVFFSITKDTFQELRQLSEMFEQSISDAAEETITTDSDVGDVFNERDADAYEDSEERVTGRSSRRTKGNKYASVMQLLLN